MTGVFVRERRARFRHRDTDKREEDQVETVVETAVPQLQAKEHQSLPGTVRGKVVFCPRNFRDPSPTPALSTL